MVTTQLASVPNDRRNDQSGQFSRTYDDEAFIDAVESIGPFATTADVRDHLGCAHDTAFRRLVSLADADRLARKKAGSSYLWSIPSDVPGRADEEASA